MKRELQRLLIEQQENAEIHISLDNEFDFYRCIQRGDTDVLLANIDATPTDGMGILSQNPLRNIKYHLIILTAMIARFCIEGGLDSEIAYTMSDFYIRTIDNASDSEMLSSIKRQIMEDYTLAMKKLSVRDSKSLHTLRAMEYIQKNLTLPLRNQDIAKNVGVNADYLSRLFKKEIGFTLSQYVTMKKCETAKYMLENSSATITQISAFLGFCSCSHFIDRFKKMSGMTPEEYRHTTYRSALSNIGTKKETADAF